MWLARPIYEALPYYYIVAGLLSLLGATYLDFGYWPVLCVSVGFSCLVAGLVVWLKRRDYRKKRTTVVAEAVKSVNEEG